MKTLKLEVGKTYRSRNGEEVKIIEKIGKGYWRYGGNNSKWYTESGGWDVCGAEHPDDLVEEVPEIRHSFGLVAEALTATRYIFDIPEGVKKITASQEGNRIVVEMVPEKEPKPGDVMINEEGSVYIFREVSGAGNHKHYAWLWRDGRLTYNSVATPGRPAAPEEAQPLWDALKKAGKRWNSETLQVEEIPEIDRILEWVETRAAEGNYNHKQLCWLIEEYLKHKEGEK